MEDPDHPHNNFSHHLDGRPRESHHISSASSTVTNLSSTLALSAPLILHCINHLDSGPKTPVPSWKTYQNPFYTGISTNDATPALSKQKLANTKSSERLTNLDRDHYPSKQSHEHNAVQQQKYDNYAQGYGIHAGGDARAGQQCHYNRPYGIPSLISARKLAALLWEYYDITTTSSSLDQQPDHEPSDQCMVEDSSTVRDGCNEQLVIDRNNVHAEKPAVSESLRNELPTAGSKKVSSPAVEKIGENKMHDMMSSDQAASTGAALAAILQRLKFVEENQMKSMALLRTLRLEVEDTSARLQDLEYSHKSALSEINAALQHYGEQLAAMSRRKEQEKVRAAFWHLREEMENEKEACRLLRIQNKKLGKELEQASSAAATACEELERERKARELMEDVCDELAREIGQDKAEVEELKREQALVKERAEEERKMLRMASDLWREERMRPKAQMGLNDSNEENRLALQDLKRKLEAFVATVGSACEGSREDLERQVEQAKKLREALDSLQETVEIEEEEPVEEDRGDQTHMDEEEELRETEDGDTELGHYRLESAHDLSRHGLSCSSIEKFGSSMCKSPHFEDKVRKERPVWSNRAQYSTRKVRLRRGANGKLYRVRSQDLFDGSSSTREQQFTDTQYEDTDVYDEQNLELLAFDKHSSDTSGREDHHKLSTGGENVSTETNYLKGQETNDEAQLSQEDNHRSFSDQEADHGCCLDSNYHSGKGHRKQLSLHYVDSTGKISMGRNTVDEQHTDLHHTRVQKDAYAGVYKKNGRKSEEDEPKAERSGMKTKPGHCWEQQVHSSSAARDHHEGENNNKIDDQDSDEWEDFYFEPVRAPATVPPAQNADSSQLITQNSSQAESQEQNDVGIIDSPRSAGHINATLLACPRNDKQSMVSSSKPATSNKDNSSQSSCHSPRVQKHNIPSKCSPEPKIMSKSAYSTPAMSPPLQKSGQSSSMRPLQCFWSPASPTNYAAIFGTAAGSSGKNHSHRTTCDLSESRLIPAPPHQHHHHHHQNIHHEGTQAAHGSTAILPQDIQQKAIQQPAAGQSLVKSNSLRAQLMKARQIEGNEGITTHKSAFAGRFRFSPLRSRPPSTGP